MLTQYQRTITFCILYLNPWLEQSKFWSMLPKLSELLTFKVHLGFPALPKFLPKYWKNTHALHVLIILFHFYMVVSYSSHFGTWIDSLQTTTHSIPFPRWALVPKFLLKSRNIFYSKPWIMSPCSSTGWWTSPLGNPKRSQTHHINTSNLSPFLSF